MREKKNWLEEIKCFFGEGMTLAEAVEKTAENEFFLDWGPGGKPPYFACFTSGERYQVRERELLWRVTRLLAASHSKGGAAASRLQSLEAVQRFEESWGRERVSRYLDSWTEEEG